MLVPVWRNGRVIALFGSTIHHTDVGGYGIGAGGRDVFEEGLWIPIVKLMKRGERNADVWKFILSNVRQPDHMAGDLHAQMASGEVGAQRLAALCDQHGLDDIEDLADEIIGRSEAATRAGDQGAPGRHVPLAARCSTSPTAAASTSSCALTVDTDLGEITVDYTGSSEASPWGINVVKNYTHAYTTFTVRSVLSPEIPNNHGSLAPIKMIAPEGTIVNAVSPQPCTARHVVGMFLPNALLKALAQVAPAAGDGRGVRRRVDDAGQRQPRRRQPVHHGDVHLRRRRRRPGHEVRARRLLVPDRRRRGADRGGRGVGADPLQHARRCASTRAAPVRRPAGSARRSSSRSTPPGRGSSTP